MFRRRVETLPEQRCCRRATNSVRVPIGSVSARILLIVGPNHRKEKICGSWNNAVQAPGNYALLRRKIPCFGHSRRQNGLRCSHCGISRRVAPRKHGSNEVTGLPLPAAEGCPACQRAAGAEKRAIQEMPESLRSESNGEGTPRKSVCLAHLEGLLYVLSNATAAKRILRQESEAFRRIAENLQRYALKHEGRCSDLISEEEWQAPKQALTLLTSHRNVTIPLRGVDQRRSTIRASAIPGGRCSRPGRGLFRNRKQIPELFGISDGDEQHASSIGRCRSRAGEQGAARSGDPKVASRGEPCCGTRAGECPRGQRAGRCGGGSQTCSSARQGRRDSNAFGGLRDAFVLLFLLLEKSLRKRQLKTLGDNLVTVCTRSNRGRDCHQMP